MCLCVCLLPLLIFCADCVCVYAFNLFPSFRSFPCQKPCIQPSHPSFLTSSFPSLAHTGATTSPIVPNNTSPYFPPSPSLSFTHTGAPTSPILTASLPLTHTGAPYPGPYPGAYPGGPYPGSMPYGAGMMHPAGAPPGYDQAQAMPFPGQAYPGG